MVRVVITFFASKENVEHICFGVFENPDYVYIYDDKFDVKFAYDKHDIYHMTIKGVE